MALQSRATTTPAAFSFAPSQAFEGNDGPWSTFVIRIGTPEQVFHVLISTAGQETWVPVPEGCVVIDPPNCGALRGVEPFDDHASSGFQTNASSTWIPINLDELGLEDNLNYTGNGEYGFDTVGLELPESDGITLMHQIVAGIATKDFYLGVFALGPRPTNWTNFDDPQTSFLWTLKNQSYIPSLSWSYTAGAPYRLKGVSGSLTLGGYDISRFTPNNMTFSFGPDDSRPLIVGIQSIVAINTLHGVMSLLPSGILSFIDSTVPEIWLPESACTIFETAFGLQYDPHTDRYLVNNTVHGNLTRLNPTLTFQIGNTESGGNTTTISLPYGAFDLQADYPIYKNSTNYFPLRRAVNDNQYTLGRSFLQDAYITTDYERKNFSVSQCLFEENNPDNIQAIYSPFDKESINSSLSKSALIAIIVVVVVVAMLVTASCYILFIFVKKRNAEAVKTSAKREAVNGEGIEVAFGNAMVSEIAGNKISEMFTIEETMEMVGQEMGHELPPGDNLVELPAFEFTGTPEQRIRGGSRQN